jgi:hypothetical protein
VLLAQQPAAELDALDRVPMRPREPSQHAKRRQLARFGLDRGHHDFSVVDRNVSLWPGRTQPSLLPSCGAVRSDVRRSGAARACLQQPIGYSRRGGLRVDHSDWGLTPRKPPASKRFSGASPGLEPGTPRFQSCGAAAELSRSAGFFVDPGVSGTVRVFPHFAVVSRVKRPTPGSGAFSSRRPSATPLRVLVPIAGGSDRRAVG